MNAWALLYDELYGDDKMTDDNRVTPQESDEYDPKPESNAVTPQESDEYDPVITGADLTTDNDLMDTIKIDLGDSMYSTASMVDYNDYNIGLSTASTDNTFFIDTSHIGEVSIDMSNYPSYTTDDRVIVEDAPTPGIESNNPRKYKEDESIKALQDYISTTYGGHYTSKSTSHYFCC